MVCTVELEFMDLPCWNAVRHMLSNNGSGKDTECLTLFLNLFNQVLSRVSGLPSYKFNPYGLMCNEAGANFLAIEGHLGKNFLPKL